MMYGCECLCVAQMRVLPVRDESINNHFSRTSGQLTIRGPTIGDTKRMGVAGDTTKQKGYLLLQIRMQNSVIG